MELSCRIMLIKIFFLSSKSWTLLIVLLLILFMYLFFVVGFVSTFSMKCSACILVTWQKSFSNIMHRPFFPLEIRENMDPAVFLLIYWRWVASSSFIDWKYWTTNSFSPLPIQFLIPVLQLVQEILSKEWYLLLCHALYYIEVAFAKISIKL